MADESKNESNTGLCITNRRSINTREGSVLTLLYLGMRTEDQPNSKATNVLIPTPPAMFQEETNDYTTQPFDRVLIKPNSWGGDTTTFMEFLSRLEMVLLKAKTLGDRNGFRDVKWYSSVKMEEGVLTGVVCKVKKGYIKEILKEKTGKQFRFMLQVNALWYNGNPTKGGCSIEVADIMDVEEEENKVEEVKTEEKEA